MKATPLKTDRITAGSIDLLELLDKYLTDVSEGSILAITSKIVSLCENRVVPEEGADKNELVKQQSQHYLAKEQSKYGFSFTITNNTFIPASGIDASNGDGHLILWPTDSQQTANQVRAYLKKRFKLQKVGVVITDSTCMPPLRLGTMGVALAFSGFEPLRDYKDKPDLFGRPFAFSQAGLASGLAATAVLVMGEGVEQTPLALLEDLPFITFVDHDPTTEDLAALRVPLEDDLYAPFLEAVNWQPGDKLGE